MRAKKLKLADKIMNVRDITNNPPEKWTISRTRKYLDWSERVVAGLRGTRYDLEFISMKHCRQEGRSIQVAGNRIIAKIYFIKGKIRCKFRRGN